MDRWTSSHAQLFEPPMPKVEIVLAKVPSYATSPEKKKRWSHGARSRHDGNAFITRSLDCDESPNRDHLGGNAEIFHDLGSPSV